MRGDGLEGLQRFLPFDDGDTGYGVALYIGPELMVARLYDFQTNRLVSAVENRGEYAPMSTADINSIMIDMFDQMAREAGVSFSKLNVAVVSGTTAMESKVAGITPGELQHNMEDELGEFGRDVEYILAGSNAIAVGQAYFIPCLNDNVGGDFLCSMLAADVMNADEPVMLIKAGKHEDDGIVLAYGNKDLMTVCAMPKGSSVEEAMKRLLDVCKAESEHVNRAFVMGEGIKVPSKKRDEMRHVAEAAIVGASAVLLSDDAEDELCRIVSSCKLVSI